MSKKKKKKKTSSFAPSSSFCRRPWRPALQSKRVNLRSCEQLERSQLLKALGRAGARHWGGQRREMGPWQSVGRPEPPQPGRVFRGRSASSQQPGQTRSL